MVLRIILIVLVFCFHNSYVYCKLSDIKNFYYGIHLTINGNDSLLDRLKEIISESEFRAELKKLRIFAMKNKPVSSINTLTDRLNNDIKAIYKKLHFDGYYNAIVLGKIKIDEDGKVNVFIKIDLKKQFSLKVKLNLLDKNIQTNLFYSEFLDKKAQKKYASMADIKDIISTMELYLKNNGFYNPQITHKRVVIDYENNEAVLYLNILCGNNVVFGKTYIDKFSGIDENFIRNRLEWFEGEKFNYDKVKLSEENLKNTQIFSDVNINTVDEDSNNNSIPMVVKVTEDKKHILDFGIMYSGVKNMNFDKKSNVRKGLKALTAKLSWTRLNAFGCGEKFMINTEGTPMKANEKRMDYAFEASLTQPDIFTKNGDVNYIIGRKQELTNVFFKKSDKVGVYYSYSWLNSLYPSIGLFFENNFIDSDPVFFFNNKLSKNYKGWGIPLDLTIDQTDDILNPTEGYKIHSNFSFFKLNSHNINDLKSYVISYTYNCKLMNSRKNVFALYLAKKGIINSKIDFIPLDKRIYAGGINSVRGYANQMASEKIKGIDSISGGKSSIEFNTELRHKINKDWGGTIFFDGAKVFGNQSKCFEIENKRWFYSIGFGIRYFTEIGPIRLDFAFPINRRKEVDSKMQFIMSLGQAF